MRIEDSAAKLSVDKVDGKNIAVIKIPSFYIGLTSDVRKLLAQMKEKKRTLSSLIYAKMAVVL